MNVYEDAINVRLNKLRRDKDILAGDLAIARINLPHWTDEAIGRMEVKLSCYNEEQLFLEYVLRKAND